jgi:hypothetical protein
MIAATLRRPIAIPMLLAAGGLVALLAAGAGVAGASGPWAVASGSPSKAQATAFARAVNLTASDVPGFKASKGSGAGPKSKTEANLEHELLLCVHPASTKSTVELSSPDYERPSATGQQSVQSGVTIAPSAALASEELARVRSASARACATSALERYFAGEKSSGATVGAVSIAHSTPSAPGTGGGFVWRISIPITAGGVKISPRIDVLGFVYGPAEVSLVTSSVPGAFPVSTEQHLFSLLVSRAKAHQI